MSKVTIKVCNKEYRVDKDLWYSIENLINKYINNIINLQQRIDKSIEYTNELIDDTKGMLDNMKYQDKKETITRFV